MKNRSSEEQIIGFLKEGDQGLPVKERCRERGFSEASFYLRLRKCGGMSVSDAKQLKELEAENVKLKKLLAESLFEDEVIREALPGDHGHERGLAALYRRRPDRNAALRAQIVAQAQRFRRYGVGMIHLKCRTDQDAEFTGQAMLNWAHSRGIALRLIEPGKPNQNAYVESFNVWFRDECLNEHGFLSLAHARAVMEDWRREYIEERPKRSLGGPTPAQYATQLVARPLTMPADFQTHLLLRAGGRPQGHNQE